MEHLLTTALNVVVSIVATAAGTFAVALLMKLAKKAGLDITQQQQDILKADVVNAVQSVQEKAGRAISAGQPLSSQDKHALATEIVSAKQPGVPLAAISEMIDATLPEVRAKLETKPSVAAIAVASPPK